MGIMLNVKIRKYRLLVKLIRGVEHGHGVVDWMLQAMQERKHKVKRLLRLFRIKVLVPIVKNAHLPGFQENLTNQLQD